MSLVTMRDLFNGAKKGSYALGAFNIFNLETLASVIEVAEELKAPVIIGVPERLYKFVDVEILSAAMIKAAHKTSVPTAIHLDHGYTFEGVMKALRWGFSSIMYDGSNLPYEDNLKKTKEISKIARALGVSIEAEIADLSCYEYVQDEEAGNFAQIGVEKAAEFVAKTKIDALGIAYSNHGHRSHRQGMKLNIEELAKLQRAVNLPFVLHGAKKMEQDEYKQVIDNGVYKINVATDMFKVEVESLKQELAKHPRAHLMHLMSIVKKNEKEAVKKCMLQFGCISKM